MCEKSFAMLLGFSERTLKRWLSQFKKLGLVTLLHGNCNKSPSHAFSDADKELVKVWISRFAKQEGEEKPGRFNLGRLRDTFVSLPPHYTLKSIFNIYMSDQDRPIQQIGYESFRILFHTLPLKIESPKSDVCDECSQYKLKISVCSDEAELQDLNSLFSSHLIQVRYAREEYHVDSRMKSLCIFPLILHKTCGYRI